MMAAASLPAAAQKHGGVLTLPHVDTPPSPSIHEEGTASVVTPFMPLFNNLVLFDQHIAQNRFDTIVPELATAWKWTEDGTTLTFTLHPGVTWHDGKPFTAADVKCTWDMVSGLVPGKIRRSPRQAWFINLKEISVNGDHEVSFHLKQPQPSLIAMLATGWSPVYPCHVPSATMRTKPIGTGPFRFVEYRLNESMRVQRNPNYWKPGLPYLDGIEYQIVPNRATRMLAFTAGKFDMTYPTDVTVPLMRDVRSQNPDAQCVMRTSNVSTNLIINRDAPPFNNLEIRRALVLTLDRKAFIDIQTEGTAVQAGTMLPPPAGVWGMPPEEMRKMFGYDPDIEKQRAAARAIMKSLGYGPDNLLRTKVFTRNTNSFRDPALILSDQLKTIWFETEVEAVETPIYYNRVFKKDYSIGLNLTGASLDDPDQQYLENYACGSLRNYTNYCNADLEKDISRQSMEMDFTKRRAIVWEIERKLAEDVARPIIFHGVAGACWHPYVKNVTIMVNSVYNGWRWEDIWMDK
ncbi:MAG: ABC transporter substrate-binding protein [Acetobacteraceae bacterium]|nr:ABC transporter substrate-binding protein [Acetobacteraceae bacterium]